MKILIFLFGIDLEDLQPALSWSILFNYCSCRELLESMQAGRLEPEVAFLNASLA